ncbi:MAG: sugar phosphate nucleotidyltransferase [Bacteroidales bacterium]
MSEPTLLVLAAGIGSRYGSLKQLDRLGPNGETIIDYSVFDARRAGFEKVVFVIRRNIEKEFNEIMMNKLAGKIKVDYVLQEIENISAGLVIHPERVKPWGTAHAVLMAKDVIKEPFAVINADDFYGADAYRVMYQHLKNAKEGEYAMVGYELRNTLSEHGTVSRGICEPDENRLLVSVTERTKIAPEGEAIVYIDEHGNKIKLDPETIVSMNFWGFTNDFFEKLEKGFDEFIRENSNTIKSEFYIPTIVNNLLGTSGVSVKVLQSSARWFGVTYREDRAHAVSELAALTGSGEYPENLY